MSEEEKENKPLKNMVRSIKDPEEKIYLICYTCREDNETIKSWELLTGRTEAYEFVKSMSEYIDFNNSFILVETQKLMNKKSLVEFMNYCKYYYFNNDNYDVLDYVGMVDTEEGGLIDNSFIIDNDERLDMKDILDNVLQYQIDEEE